MIISSWGNVVRGEHALCRMRSRFHGVPDIAPHVSLLPFGNGRSYGDSCLNVGGTLLQMRSLDRFIEFDRIRGILKCESGVLLGEVLRLIVPHGWFLPVLPGTQYVTVGGAIANDVHGKNHHVAGTFGRHVREIELLQTSGQRLLCSPGTNAEWFGATVGGLGLTGIITAVELQLRPIRGPWMSTESLRFASLDEFLALGAESESAFEYIVAWIDCVARGRRTGRGILQRANHSERTTVAPPPGPNLSVPFSLPGAIVSPLTVRLFNTVHYGQHSRALVSSLTHYERFFFPLDRIQHWNRLYGCRGFYQYQCVIPAAAAKEHTTALLRSIAASGLGSFLAVIKQFGKRQSPGMLSFPIPGVTLALDFPNTGKNLSYLFSELDAIVVDAGGRLYPAKDGRMSAAMFRAGYPQSAAFCRFKDIGCSSSFWRRTMSEAAESQEKIAPISRLVRPEAYSS